MRPTITEQVRHAIRVLGAEVLPEVDGRYAAEPLRSVMAALEWIADHWETVVADLGEESDDWAALLGRAGARPYLAAVAAEIALLCDETAVPLRHPRFGPVHELNLRWRDLGARVIPIVDAAGESDPDAAALHRDMTAMLRTHATHL